jgi:glyoxylase-like metal-dependent hydrolase (beta-lactamase superfamily II)
MTWPVIEDEFHDVLEKAMRGLGLSVEALATRAGLSVDQCRGLLAGRPEAASLARVANELNLHPGCLLRLADAPAAPGIELPEGVCLHNTPFPVPGYEAMTINSYSVAAPGETAEGILIDAGASFDAIIKERKQGEVDHWRLFLTHTHPDHIVHFSPLQSKASEAFAPAGEPYEEAQPVRDGEVFSCGPWKLTALATPGHSPGGTSYFLEGASEPVVFVGDAIFCCSIGKVGTGYPEALSMIREKILGLPENTVICPGHGPPTTVGFEKKNNPFFG